MDLTGRDSDDSPHDSPRGAAQERLDAAARMREAITALTNGTGSREQVQDAARELVDELRQNDLFPEQVLLRIKEILAEAGLRPSYASPADFDLPPGPRAEAAIYRDVIEWSIRAYYEDRKTE